MVSIRCRFNSIHAGGVGHLVKCPFELQESENPFLFTFLPPMKKNCHKLNIKYENHILKEVLKEENEIKDKCIKILTEDK